MPTPFHDLKIAGLDEERCYRLGTGEVRLYLQLSEKPPVGWSYLLIRAWQSMIHARERRVGIEDGAIWIECPPAELKSHHLAELESALAQANQQFWSAVERRLNAERAQREAARQMDAELAALAEHWNPPAQPFPEETSQDAGSGFRGRRFWRMIWDAF
jgi:hypothetical protein